MNTFLFLHIITIVPVLLLGPFILFRKRGDWLHVILGRIWAGLMVVSCLLTFGVTGSNGKFSWLHGLSAFTIIEVIRAIWAIRKKNIKVHQRAMVWSYVGAIVAFLFAVAVPERLMHEWFMGFLR